MSACPAAVGNTVQAAHDLEPCIAIAFRCDPEFSGLLIGSQVQKFSRPAEVQKHTDLSGPGDFDHVKLERTVCRKAPLDDHKDHTVGGIITFVQLEGRWRCLRCVSAGGFFLHNAAHAV